MKIVTIISIILLEKYLNLKNINCILVIAVFLLKRSILFKVTIIFFPSLIRELISFNSFLFKSPETINNIISELFIHE